MTDWPLEIFKLSAQLAGALAISWLTVRWALGRYKSEKMWERETQAITDILTALTQMDRALQMALRLKNRELSADDKIAEYRDARQRVAEVGAAATLLLDDEVILTLDILGSKLDKNGNSGWAADVMDGIEAVAEARSAMVAVATHRRRELMSPGSRTASRKFWHEDSR